MNPRECKVCGGKALVYRTQRMTVGKIQYRSCVSCGSHSKTFVRPTDAREVRQLTSREANLLGLPDSSRLQAYIVVKVLRQP